MSLEPVGFNSMFEAEETRNCQAHGDYVSKNFMKHWSPCPACFDEKSKQETDERIKEIEANLAAKTKNEWEQKLGAACIPLRFRDRSFDSYTAENELQEKALAFAKGYAENFKEIRKTGKSAIFFGEPGTGKTHLSCAIAKHIMEHENASVLFITALRAIRRIKSTWHHSSKETENDAVQALAFPDLLIIDEIGVQFGSDTETMYLFDILNERYENRKPTILLSNCDREELLKYLGRRIVDRLKEDGGEVVAFDWESHRGKQFLKLVK